MIQRSTAFIELPPITLASGLTVLANLFVAYDYSSEASYTSGDRGSEYLGDVVEVIEDTLDVEHADLYFAGADPDAEPLEVDPATERAAKRAATQEFFRLLNAGELEIEVPA